MRIELLEILQCPICRHENFEIIVSKETEVEIRSGFLKCPECQNIFDIKDGIPNLLVNPSNEIINVQLGWAELEKAVVNTDELMLSLPDATGEHMSAWSGQAVNFHFMWSKIKLTGMEKILDLGSGRCWSTRYFSQVGCYAVGLDILLTKYVGLLTSDIYIQKEGTYFDRVLGDMNDQPFRPEAFDLVFVAATLHHSSDIRKTVKLIERVLKPGGRLVVVNEPVVSIFQNKNLECPECDHGINEHVYWLWEYLTAIKLAGFNHTLYPYIGSYNSFLSQINQKIKRIFPMHISDQNIVPPLLFMQLLIFGVL